jgi:type I restriction enzyme M protein
MAKNSKLSDNNEKVSLETVLWNAASKLIGSVMPHNYMNVCLGLIFLKYISDRYEAKYNELKAEGSNEENDRDAYTADNVFYVPNKARWAFISKHSKQIDIGQILDNALIAIEKDNSELKNILPKIYSKGEIDKRRLGELIDIFTNQLSTENMQGDFFGRCYEYFLGEFSKKFGQKGGEFYTPRSVVDLIVNMIEPFKGRVYDPCCGSGGMFSQSIKFIKEHQGNIDDISVYGQELNPDTWRLAKMNLAIRGISANLGGSCGDTFHDDKHKTLRADFIMANPPFNISDYGQPSLIGDPRWVYDTPPEGNANYAWIQHIVSKLAPKGITGFVLANGSLSTNSKQEYNIRKLMLEKDGGIIDCIIALPTNLFSTVTIPASLWFLRKSRNNTNKTLFIDCREKGVMINRKVRELTDREILEISEIYHNWRLCKGYKDIKGFCKSATLEEIKTTDYSLVPGRYVGIDDSNKQSKEEIEAEIKKVKQELKELMAKGKDLNVKILKILNGRE